MSGFEIGTSGGRMVVARACRKFVHGERHLDAAENAGSSVAQKQVEWVPAKDCRFPITMITTRSFAVLGAFLATGLAVFGYQVGRTVKLGREFDRYLTVRADLTGSAVVCGLIPE